MESVNILWTGGWDSTFRVLQLSTKEVNIQPYYLRDNWRKSEEKEIDNIALLTELIRALPTTICTFSELIIGDVSKIDKDEDIYKAFITLRQAFKKTTNRQIGEQFEWLARFSKSVGNLELSAEKGTRPADIINTYGATKKVNDDKIGMYYIVDKENSSNDIINFFGNFHLPLLDYTKLSMKKEAEDNGFIDIMNKTWFCYTPIADEPCGSCNPCFTTIEAGLEYRFSDAALRRYKLEKKIIRPITAAFRKTLIYRIPFKIYRMIK